MSSGKGKLEVHEHSYITGPNSNRCRRLIHSHDGGDQPHVHEDQTQRTGPGAYTIDKAEWLRATGMHGGGKKKFTAKPTGDQLPLVPIEPPEIKVFVLGDGGASVARDCVGPGDAPLVRMVLGMKARVASVTHLHPPRKAHHG